MNVKDTLRAAFVLWWFIGTMPLDGPHRFRRPICWAVDHVWGPGHDDYAKCMTCGYETRSPYDSKGDSNE